MTAGTEGQNGGKLVKRMQWLQEWEKAFLSKQNDMPGQDPARQPSGNEQEQGAIKEKTLALAPGEVPQAAGVERNIQSFESLPNRPECALDKSITVASCVIKEKSGPGSTAIVMATKPDIAHTTAARKPQLMSSLPPENLSYEQHNVLVVRKDGEVKLWIREQGQQSSGLAVVSQLREMFSGLGLRLAAVTLNGQRVYGREEIVAKQPESSQEHRINRIY